MKLRTFIALELPYAQKEAILEHLNIWSKVHKSGINWVKPDNLHLTLLFIGDTLSGDIPDLKEELFKAVVNLPCFRMKCLGFELFPAKEPRLLWVKLEAEDDGVFRFAKQLNRLVRDFDYTPDAKALKLHITAARIKSPQPAWLEEEFLKAALPQDFGCYDTVTFYQSILKPDGPVYISLEQFSMIKKQ